MILLRTLLAMMPKWSASNETFDALYNLLEFASRQDRVYLVELYHDDLQNTFVIRRYRNLLSIFLLRDISAPNSSTIYLTIWNMLQSQQT